MLTNYEKKIYSQNGEDGVLEHIFSKIGTTDKIAVEFGVGDGEETNTRLLAEQGWKCYWFDGAPAENLHTNVQFTQAWLTADTIVPIFEQQLIPNEFDLLSIDVDGNDYHLREALREYQPRVIVQEYNGCFGPQEEYIMNRNDDHRWRLWDKHFGASLLSLTKQADQLGYDLVHCDSRGVNAFYIRRDVNVFAQTTVDLAWKPLWWANQV